MSLGERAPQRAPDAGFPRALGRALQAAARQRTTFGPPGAGCIRRRRPRGARGAALPSTAPGIARARAQLSNKRMDLSALAA